MKLPLLSLFLSVSCVPLLKVKAGPATSAWTADYDGKDPRFIHAARSVVSVFYNNGSGNNATIDSLLPSTGEVLTSLVTPDGFLAIADYTLSNSGELQYYFVVGFKEFFLVDPAEQTIKWSVSIPEMDTGIIGTPVFNGDGSQVYVNTLGFIWKFATADGTFQKENVVFTRENESESWGPYDAALSSLTIHEGSIYAALAEGAKVSFCTRPTLYRFNAATLSLEEKWEFSDEDCGSTSVSSCCGAAEHEGAPVVVQPAQNTIVASYGLDQVGTVGFSIPFISAGPKVEIYNGVQLFDSPATGGENVMFMDISQGAAAFSLSDGGSTSTSLWNQTELQNADIFRSVEYE
jgi:outer membrane protein assembly factor BamB